MRPHTTPIPDSTDSALARGIALARRSSFVALRPARAVGAGPLASASEAAREEASWFALQMYRGNQAQFLDANPDETPEEFERRPNKTTVNFTRLAIDLVSPLYLTPPRRELRPLRPGPASDAAAARIRDVWQDDPIDPVLLQADRLARLLGVVAVRPYYEEGRVRLWLYAPHQTRIVLDGERPHTPAAAVFHWTTTAEGARAQRIAHVWTARHFARLVDGEVVEESEHGYGRIPVTFVHDSLAFDGFWVPGRGSEIAQQNAVINNKLSDLAYTCKMQGFGVLEIVNPDPHRPLVLSPGRAVEFRVQAGEPYGIAWRSPSAPIVDLIEDIRFSIQQLLASQRIPVSAVTLRADAARTGVAIEAERVPLHEERAERIQTFRSAERDLLDCMGAVLAAHEPGLAWTPRGLALSLDFPEPATAGGAAQLAADRFALKHGLSTPADLLQRDNPDAFTTPDEARERIVNNRDAGPAGTDQE